MPDPCNHRSMLLVLMLVIVIVLRSLMVRLSMSKSRSRKTRLRQGYGEARPASQARSKKWSHAHYLISAIDIDDLACDGRRAIAGEKYPGLAKLGRIATAFQRRAFLVML